MAVSLNGLSGAKRSFSQLGDETGDAASTSSSSSEGGFYFPDFIVPTVKWEDAAAWAQFLVRKEAADVSYSLDNCIEYLQQWIKGEGEEDFVDAVVGRVFPSWRPFEETSPTLNQAFCDLPNRRQIHDHFWDSVCDVCYLFGFDISSNFEIEKREDFDSLNILGRLQNPKGAKVLAHVLHSMVIFGYEKVAKALIFQLKALPLPNEAVEAWESALELDDDEIPFLVPSLASLRDTHRFLSALPPSALQKNPPGYCLALCDRDQSQILSSPNGPLSPLPLPSSSPAAEEELKVRQWDPVKRQFYDKRMSRESFDTWVLNMDPKGAIRSRSAPAPADLPPADNLPITIHPPRSVPSPSRTEVSLSNPSISVTGQPSVFGVFDEEMQPIVGGQVDTSPVQSVQGSKKWDNLSAWIDFLTREGQDDKGRTLWDIWNYSFQKLEDTHDYIQRIFPTKTPSKADSTAPYLQGNAQFTQDQLDSIRKNMKLSFWLMLAFYGFALGEEGSIVKSDSFDKQRAWLSSRGQHNFARISRILESLMLFGLEEDAALFQTALEGLYTPGNPNFEFNCNQENHDEYISPDTRERWEEMLAIDPLLPTLQNLSE